MRRTFFAALAITVAGAIPGWPVSIASAQTAPPPTLTGELLRGTPEVTANCNPDRTSTVSFTATGQAFGPFPGTFIEVGTATIGPQILSEGGGQSIGPLLSYDAVFTIDSEVGQVTGTKTLAFPVTDPARELAIGQCNTFPNAELQNFELVDVIDVRTIRYEALIVTTEGAFTDRGVVPLVAVQQVRRLDDPAQITFSLFIETFASDLAEPEPLAVQGHATGGGQIPSNVTFGFTAKSDKNGVKGKCTVIDRDRDTTVKCLDATTYFQAGAQAMFSGTATVNGMPTTYRITVDDNGEPGSGTDTFTITTESGYSAIGVLSQGNIQVRQ